MPPGEGGPVAGTPTIVNAIFDALADHVIREIDTPVTPQRVWRAIQGSPA